jgi:hypothetical protein
MGSILNIVLELYILLRILFLMKPPRLQCATIQDTLVVQAGSLLLFDLLVIAPEAILTDLVAEFIPFSIGALAVLGQPAIEHVSLACKANRRISSGFP